MGSEIDSTTEAGRARAGQRNARGPMSNATILVVDDDAQIRRVLQATLSSNGYDVIKAKNGKEAITAVLREHPDVILLDVNMPGMSGFEACSKDSNVLRWPDNHGNGPRCRTRQGCCF
jgi:PleD family two-component response regulator